MLAVGLEPQQGDGPAEQCHRDGNVEQRRTGRSERATRTEAGPDVQPPAGPLDRPSFVLGAVDREHGP